MRCPRVSHAAQAVVVLLLYPVLILCTSATLNS